ncbi:ATP-binding protein [Streptomyces sp. PR69]|uniref:ATP-binding protein n=1 Tax=Streptomyces sp. PR69 TaxID=2984950 RepID=UPI002264368A|nr:ATP-binding protein [Streptomyces sp. PR69]
MSSEHFNSNGSHERRRPAPGWLYVSSLRLAAVGTAAGVARMFVRHHLTYLGLSEHVADGELVVSELVTNAVEATGIADPAVKLHDIQAEHLVALQLRVVDTRLFIEVWDRSVEEPVRKDAGDDAEGGRGLVLVEALAQRWGVAHPPAGGKVVWAELVIGKAPAPRGPFGDRPRLERRVPQGTRPPRGVVFEAASTALLERVLEGLRVL